MRTETKFKGGGLIQLSPLDSKNYITAPPYFYGILGWDITLDYIIDKITDRKNTESVTRKWGKAYHNDVIENLETIIKAVSEGPKPNESSLDIDYQIRETLKNYYNHVTKEQILPTEIRRRFQSYKNIFENLEKGYKLSEQEEKDKQDFLNITKFFLNLEREHKDWERHLDALDDE